MYASSLCFPFILPFGAASVETKKVLNPQNLINAAVSCLDNMELFALKHSKLHEVRQERWLHMNQASFVTKRKH